MAEFDKRCQLFIRAHNDTLPSPRCASAIQIIRSSQSGGLDFAAFIDCSRPFAAHTCWLQVRQRMDLLRRALDESFGKEPFTVGCPSLAVFPQEQFALANFRDIGENRYQQLFSQTE
jgi:hypothetical protein